MKTKLVILGLLFQAGLFLLPVGARADSCIVNSQGACEPGQPVRLPLKIYRNFLVIAEGQLGGVPGQQNFVLDTGTSPSVINMKLATQLGLRTTTSSTLALGTQVSAQASTIPEINLGPMHASFLPVLVKDLSRLETDIGIPIAGIIGMDVLSKSNFILDYDKKEIDFGDITHEGIPVRFDARAGIAVAEVRIGGRAVRMLVDTGSELVVLLGGNFGETEWPALRNTSQLGASVADLKMRVQEFSAPDIRIGGRHFSKDSVYFVPGSTDPAFDGLLGVRALGFRSVSYDRASATIYLQ